MSITTKTPLTPQATWHAVNQAIESNVDPMGMATPLLHAQMAWLSHPQELADELGKFSSDLMALQWHSWQRSLGMPSDDLVKPHADDTRFSDPQWQDTASWDIAKEWYLLFTHQMQDMLYETPGMSNKDRRRAAFWWRKWLNAMAPTNFLWTNPVAMRKAIETNGESLVKGAQNFLADLKAGTVRMTNPDDFTVGKNLATTPGKVVFRNRLLEVLHYTPTVEKNFENPIVIVTPWINKYYVLDLTAKKSMIKFLLDQGYSVFITSWKNPDQSMRDVRFDDYIADGVGAIVETARAISGAKQVHAAGYCIGGAALATYMAWANRHYASDQVPVKSVTFFTTLVDYHKPGDIEVFLDESSFKWLSGAMNEKGFLDGNEMASAFRLLRSNSLVWHYVVHGYLYGEKPPPFDVLYWNMDTTRMPAAMHQWYLREFYLNNNLIKKDSLMVAGEKIDLGRIVQPVYAVSAEDDHVAPWRQTFRINNVVSGPKRFVLSSSGHILGIVNPVVDPPKREYRVGLAERHDTPDSWQERAEPHPGSWWEDWMEWLKPQSGNLVKAGPVATKSYPALSDAPGTYVLEA
ncbi:MAG: alpha/beta fold hydrolase [Proteobacteria bacterium]|nr:alpha/beta fold hydrolase [Pseudomonadota bacterium]